MHSQGLLHAFTQTPRRTRIEIHQFAMQLVQRLFGGGIVLHCVSRIQSFRNSWLLLVREMIQHVAALMNLAALDSRRFTRTFSRLRSAPCRRPERRVAA